MKFTRNAKRREAYAVRPLAGAGIEIIWDPLAPDKIAFAPSRGRELKFVLNGENIFTHPFAPSRGRELKYSPSVRDISKGCVRPLAGAGIEIQPRPS